MEIKKNFPATCRIPAGVGTFYQNNYHAYPSEIPSLIFCHSQHLNQGFQGNNQAPTHLLSQNRKRERNVIY
jgi:hypothetical protein